MKAFHDKICIYIRRKVLNATVKPFIIEIGKAIERPKFPKYQD